MYLVNGSIKGTESYVKHLIDRVRELLKKRDLKASRTKVAIAWSLDPNEMRGDKLELLSTLESKLKDYIGDVERQSSSALDLYPTEKVRIVIACSRTDFMRISSRVKQNSDFIIMKANPICEIIG
jgi:translation elongation factor EF-Tu-like GTPase